MTRNIFFVYSILQFCLVASGTQYSYYGGQPQINTYPTAYQNQYQSNYQPQTSYRNVNNQPNGYTYNYPINNQQNIVPYQNYYPQSNNYYYPQTNYNQWGQNNYYPSTTYQPNYQMIHPQGQINTWNEHPSYEPVPQQLQQSTPNIPVVEKIYESCQPDLSVSYANLIRGYKAISEAFKIVEDTVTAKKIPESLDKILILHGLLHSLYQSIHKSNRDAVDEQHAEFLKWVESALQETKKDFETRNIVDADKLYNKIENLLADAWASTEATLRMFNSGEEFKPLPPDIAQEDGTLDFSFHEQLPPPMYAFVPLGERSNVPHKYQSSEYCYTEQ